ncbi:MAG: hypothetical protein ABIK62_00030 [candidate division WOR-3 bacterium]
MRFRDLPLAVCLLVATGARAQQLMSSEFPIDTGIVYGPAYWAEKYPDIAFDGTNYLVVWVDGRDARADHIYATRVTPEGKVLDFAGIQISTGDAGQSDPAVAFDGTNYLVVFTDWPEGFGDIYAARVTPGGLVLDPQGIAVSTRPRNQMLPEVAFNGTNYLVVWQEDSSAQFAYDVYAGRVTPQGVVLDPDGIRISAGPEREEAPHVTRQGTGFLVVWLDKRNGDDDIYAARVSGDGVVLDPNGIAIAAQAGNQDEPSAAWDGTNSLVVWKDNRAESLDIYGARVTPQGAVLDPNGIRISAGPGWQYEPHAAFDGTNYLVVWSHWTGQSQDHFDIYAGRITPQGSVLDSGGFRVSGAPGEQWYEKVAYGNGSFLVVWQDERREQEDVFGARVTAQGAVLDTPGLVVAAVANEQWGPKAAFDGANYLVAWEDYRSGEYADVYVTRLSPLGRVLDPAPVPLVTLEGDQDKVAACFDGTNYLVVWEDGRSSGDDDIFACRVTTAGSVLDTGGIAVSDWGDDQGQPAVARGSAGCLVVWEDRRNGQMDIYGARLAPDGTVLDPDGILISGATGLQWRSDVAFDGTNWLVVWQDSRSGQGYDIYASRVSQDGRVLDTAGLAVCTAQQGQWSPKVAFDGTRYLVVWEDPRSGAREVYGARVAIDGAVLDTSGICIAGGTTGKNSPAVSYDGNEFLVVWSDERGGVTETDIYGVRVNGQGVVTDSFPVVRQTGWQDYPALAHGSGDQMLLVYEGWATCNATRAWAKLSPLPGIETIPNPEMQTPNPRPTVVRGALELAPAAVGLSGRFDYVQRWTLLDASGRKVQMLMPGANDVSRLAPGVYFVTPKRLSGRQGQSITKVILTR